MPHLPDCAKWRGCEDLHRHVWSWTDLWQGAFTHKWRNLTLFRCVPMFKHEAFRDSSLSEVSSRCHAFHWSCQWRCWLLPIACPGNARGESGRCNRKRWFVDLQRCPLLMFHDDDDNEDVCFCSLFKNGAWNAFNGLPYKLYNTLLILTFLATYYVYHTFTSVDHSVTFRVDVSWQLSLGVKSSRNLLVTRQERPIKTWKSE